MDIINKIHEHTTPNTKFSHVYGHQDNKNDPIDDEAYLNCLNDQIVRSNAKQNLQIHPTNTIGVYVNAKYIPYNVW